MRALVQSVNYIPLQNIIWSWKHLISSLQFDPQVASQSIPSKCRTDNEIGTKYVEFQSEADRISFHLRLISLAREGTKWITYPGSLAS